VQVWPLWTRFDSEHDMRKKDAMAQDLIGMQRAMLLKGCKLTSCETGGSR